MILPTNFMGLVVEPIQRITVTKTIRTRFETS